MFITQKNIKQSGQSTIEFIFSFSMILGFVFLFIRIANSYANGFMVHFATYMASRTYLVVDNERYNSPEEGDARAFNYAQIVFKKYLYPGIEADLRENNPSQLRLPVFTGVYADFGQSLSAGMMGLKEKVELRSEAFLGREPTRLEVYTQVCKAIRSITRGGCSVHSTLDDNGG